MIHAHTMGEFVGWATGREQPPLLADAQAALEALRRGPCWRSDLDTLDQNGNMLKSLARRGVLIERVTEEDGGVWYYLIREPGQHRYCPDCGTHLSAYNPGLYCAQDHVRRVMADEPLDPPPPSPFCHRPAKSVE